MWAMVGGRKGGRATWYQSSHRAGSKEPVSALPVLTMVSKGSDPQVLLALPISAHLGNTELAALFVTASSSPTIPSPGEVALDDPQPPPRLPELQGVIGQQARATRAIRPDAQDTVGGGLIGIPGLRSQRSYLRPFTAPGCRPRPSLPTFWCIQTTGQDTVCCPQPSYMPWDPWNTSLGGGLVFLMPGEIPLPWLQPQASAQTLSLQLPGLRGALQEPWN